MDFLQLTLILFLISLLIVFICTISYFSKRRQDPRETKLPDDKVFSEDHIEPFIMIKDISLNTTCSDAETKNQISILKNKMDMFKMRNQFYEIEKM